MRAAPPYWLLVLVALCAVLAACGKSSAPPSSEAPAAGAIPPLSAAGAVGVATKNTTRLGGGDAVSDAAAVARTVYPGLTSTTRPQAVVLVDAHDWTSSLAASALASAPLGAPLLYSEGGAVGGTTVGALRAMSPVGAPALGGAQVIEIGTTAGVPAGLRTRTVSSTGEPAAVAARVAHLLSRSHVPSAAIVVADGAPRALQMPAAGLSAESGAPILFVSAGSVPTATAAVLEGLHRPDIFIVDPSAVNSHGLAALARFGPVTPIVAGATPAAPVSPAENADAVARFAHGSFGWGVKEPGHGLVFANAGRPFDAPASALLSASGDFAPLLLLESADAVPPTLATYLGDIQPAYGSAPQFQPVHGAYNHGWLIGDEHAISISTQAEIDSMLEISPSRTTSSEEESSASPSE